MYFLFSVAISRYLTGNPCAAFKFYRLYVIGTLPQLESLDGVAVLHTERLAAKANFDYIQSEILEQESISIKQVKMVDVTLHTKDDSLVFRNAQSAN